MSKLGVINFSSSQESERLSLCTMCSAWDERKSKQISACGAQQLTETVSQHPWPGLASPCWPRLASPSVQVMCLKHTAPAPPNQLLPLQQRCLALNKWVENFIITLGWKRNWKTRLQSITSKLCFSIASVEQQPALAPALLMIPTPLLQWSPRVVLQPENLLCGPAMNIQIHSLAFFLQPDQFPILSRASQTVALMQPSG